MKRGWLFFLLLGLSDARAAVPSTYVGAETVKLSCEIALASTQYFIDQMYRTSRFVINSNPLLGKPVDLPVAHSKPVDRPVAHIQVVEPMSGIKGGYDESPENVLDTLNSEFYGFDPSRARFSTFKVVNGVKKEYPVPVFGRKLPAEYQEILEPVSSDLPEGSGVKMLLFHQLDSGRYVGHFFLGFVEVEPLKDFKNNQEKLEAYILSQSNISQFLMAKGINVRPFLMTFRSGKMEFMGRAAVLGDSVKDLEVKFSNGEMSQRKLNDLKLRLHGFKQTLSRMFKSADIINGYDVPTGLEFDDSDFLFVNGDWMLVNY